MRFVKIPAILSTEPDLSRVVIRKRQRENRETISIVKPQLINLPVFWLIRYISVCEWRDNRTKVASTAANKLR